MMKISRKWFEYIIPIILLFSTPPFTTAQGDYSSGGETEEQAFTFQGGLENQNQEDYDDTEDVQSTTVPGPSTEHPVNGFVVNWHKGNVTGVVDKAFAIRGTAPTRVRDLVVGMMQLFFGNTLLGLPDFTSGANRVNNNVNVANVG